MHINIIIPPSHVSKHCAYATSPSVTTEQANKDFKRECVLLNDVPFIPDQDDPDRCHAFSFTMELLLERMVHNRSRVCDKCLYPSFVELTDVVMQRACRTSAGADSFFTIQQLLVVEGNVFHLPLQRVCVMFIIKRNHL